MIDWLNIDALQIHGGATIKAVSLSMGSPGPRDAMAARPSDHGATDVTRFYGPRSWELTGNIEGPDMGAMWEAVDAVKGALVLGSTHVMTFQRTGLTFDERAVVRVGSPVDAMALSSPAPLIRFGVSLLAADPRIYSNTLNTSSYDPTDSGTGGLVFPLVFPLDFQASDTAGRMSVDNEGNIASPPIFVVTGPVTNPIIDNETTGESIYTQETGLASGDTLTVDVAARSVVLNGTTSRPDLLDSSRTDWLYIEPGVNQLRLRGSDMVATETELAVSFRNARI